MNKKHSITNIQRRYKNFEKEQRDIWESFCLIEFYMPYVKNAIKNDIFPALQMDRVWSKNVKKLKKDETYGAWTSLTDRGNYRRTLLEAVLIFENYMTDLMEVVYLDYPNKINASIEKGIVVNDNDNTGYLKLLKLILDSNSKEEMLEKLVEEKIRSIFYGNPLDIFKKDKARLEFGNFFKNNCSNELKELAKIIAVRNIIVHNNGVIDSKYIKETKSTQKVGTKIKIDKKFIKNSIFVLSKFSIQSTRLIIENVYKDIPQGNLKRAVENL